MSVSPSSYEAFAVDYAITMLAASATFQALLGVGTPTLAKGSIINTYGGDPGRAGGEGKTVNCLGVAINRPTTYAEVNAESFEEEQIGLAEYKRYGDILIFVQMATTNGDTPPDMIVRARNAMGAIKADITNQFGLSGCLIAGSIKTQGPSLPDTTGGRRGTIEFLLTISWRDMP